MPGRCARHRTACCSQDSSVSLSVQPPGRRFPPHLTLKQRYGLLGNSLSVDVVAALLRYLLGQADSSGAEPAALAYVDGVVAH